MGASGGRKTSSSKSSNRKTTKSTAKSSGKSGRKKSGSARQDLQDGALFHEIGLIVLFALMVLLFCCNFGIIGPAGNAVSGFLFGLFGLTAYAAPVLLFLAAAFRFANEGNPSAVRKLAAGVVLFFMIGIVCDLTAGISGEAEGYSLKLIYESCRDGKTGGGILGGSISYFLRHYLGTIGAVLVVLVCSMVCLILLTEKSLIDGVKKGGSRVREISMEEAERYREGARKWREDGERRREQARIRRAEQEEQGKIRRQEQEEQRSRREEARRLKAEERENEKILRMEKKFSGVMLNTALPRPEENARRDDIHEIILPEEETEAYPAQDLSAHNETGSGAQPRNVQDLQGEAPEGHPVQAGEESGGAFSRWDVDEMPIRIHKEGVEEVYGEQDSSSESDFHGMREVNFTADSTAWAEPETVPEFPPPGEESRNMPEDGQPESVAAESGSGSEAGRRKDATEPEYGQTEGGNAAEPWQPETEETAGYLPPEAGDTAEPWQPETEGTAGYLPPEAGDTAEPWQPETEGTAGYLPPEAGDTAEPWQPETEGTAGPLPPEAGDTAEYRPTGAGNQPEYRQADAGQMRESAPFQERSSSVPAAEAVRRLQAPGKSGEVSPGIGRQRPLAGLSAGPAGTAAGMRVEAASVMDDTFSAEIAGKVNAAISQEKAPKKYLFPPIDLLQKGAAATGESIRELKETAMHLQQTLATFGVKVTITDISQGPSVTRYELQPEQGVKVSKIVGLADDIKLNLAALDIRIEAPIPGKAAIGIEVPNKESIPVMLRDLLETEEFRQFPSNVAFAVGKDIAGKVVVSDIAKMPHMLIAGATGSGKSVCINTLIMGILYKAHPDDVKLILVDPKVVELSVYNGIPHLLIPVVTDPKKASAALHWGVAEMEDRYRKFAEYNVRDLKGYNKKAETLREKDPGCTLKKLPQIIIIVDELADLMMVCPGEVEESICRLAQLARAAGIHLIIATQRPSVDVITGLIKANMPSRVAFSVSSGVDSRTILDVVGAEKLLGKGDMLFYPQGYPKPARVQGAFVSDSEVSDVVDFLKNQALGNTYAADIEEKIKSIGSSAGGGASGGGVDDLFEKAGRLIIDKDKASIGMLQRALQIGFNRAARIMDQLCDYGVVGDEEGTKPRKILMSPERFEQLLEEL